MSFILPYDTGQWTRTPIPRVRQTWRQDISVQPQLGNGSRLGSDATIADFISVPKLLGWCPLSPPSSNVGEQHPSACPTRLPRAATQGRSQRTFLVSPLHAVAGAGHVFSSWFIHRDSANCQMRVHEGRPSRLGGGQGKLSVLLASSQVTRSALKGWNAISCMALHFIGPCAFPLASTFVCHSPTG